MQVKLLPISAATRMAAPAGTAASPVHPASVPPGALLGFRNVVEPQAAQLAATQEDRANTVHSASPADTTPKGMPLSRL